MTLSKAIILYEDFDILDEIKYLRHEFHLMSNIYYRLDTISLHLITSKKNNNIKDELIKLGYKEIFGRSHELVYKVSTKYDSNTDEDIKVHCIVYLLDENEEYMPKIAKYHNLYLEHSIINDIIKYEEYEKPALEKQ